MTAKQIKECLNTMQEASDDAQNELLVLRKRYDPEKMDFWRRRWHRYNTVVAMLTRELELSHPTTNNT